MLIATLKRWGLPKQLTAKHCVQSASLVCCTSPKKFLREGK
jgi:hypothetical protein